MVAGPVTLKLLNFKSNKMPTTTKKNKLILFWENLEKTGDKIKISRAAKSLQRQAEIDKIDNFSIFVTL